MKTKGRILLHTCCGVCASHCVQVLRADGWEPVLFYSNHNLFPHAEWCRRRDAVRQLAAAEHVEWFEDSPNHTAWQDAVAKGFEQCKEGGERCTRCFSFSLARAFNALEQLHCTAFTTSLSVSPHKRSATLHAVGKEIGGDRFIPYDFKKQEGFKDSNQRAAALGLYRQIYCGCEFSMRHREPFRIVILGMGYRGRIYAEWALAHPTDIQVIAIADSNPALRMTWATRLGLLDKAVSSDWAIALETEGAEGVIIALPDPLHFPAAQGALARHLHVLLEKPIGATWEECVALDAAVRSGKSLVQVGHILRYTPYYQKIAELLHRGSLGEVVSIRHLEPVGYWKAAHTFCRGTWGNTAQSTPMILQKCSHDFDLFAWWIGKRGLIAQSFGGLAHFRPDHAPQGAAKYCIACPSAIECRCPYSARKLLCERESLWYALPTHTPEALETLLHGVYGRCVYACENDAVDHQVVNLLFEGGVTVSHSMEAYTWERDRQTRICCTRGEIIGDARTLTIHHFDSRTTEQWDAALESGTATHESSYILGNDGLMRDWVEAMRTLPPTAYVERFHESIQSHALAFAAEYSRLNGGAPVPIASL